MLHMVVINHGPDTCAAAHDDVAELAKSGFGGLSTKPEELSATIKGIWVDMPAHALWALVDAPNAHVVSRLMAEQKIMNWNTVVVHPIMTMDEALGKVE